VILLDTSGLLAAIDGSQRMHQPCANALVTHRGPLLLSPFVLAELDYLLGTRVSAAAQDALLEEVARGAYRLEPFSAEDVSQARAIATKYRSLNLGLADSSIVVLAERHGIRDVLTLDERHFRALRVGKGAHFRILPADLPRAR
jgi:predicted nucleic acid-binding protein